MEPPKNQTKNTTTGVKKPSLPKNGVTVVKK